MWPIFFSPTFLSLYGMFLAFFPRGCAYPFAQTQAFYISIIRKVLTYVEKLGPIMTVAGEIYPKLRSQVSYQIISELKDVEASEKWAEEQALLQKKQHHADQVAHLIDSPLELHFPLEESCFGVAQIK